MYLRTQTPEEIDAVMRSGMGADQIITQAILKVRPSDECEWI
jgi:hypothetical protein